MAHIARKVTVSAPLSAVYDTWSRYAELAEALPSVKRIERIDEANLRWHVSVAGRDTSFDAEIVEQVPDTRIAWRSTEGPSHTGVVAFRGLAEAVTEVEVTMDVPADALALSDAVVEDQLGTSVAKNLRRFKRRVEAESGVGASPVGRLGQVARVAVGLTAACALAWGVRGLLARPKRPVWSRWSRRGRPSLRDRVAPGLAVAAGAVAAGGLARHVRARRR